MQDLSPDLRRRMLGVLGMAYGAGAAVCGNEKIRAGFKRVPPVLLLVAADASPAESERLIRRFPGTLTVRAFTADELSQAVGRERAVFIAMKPHGLSELLKKSLGAEALPPL